MVVLGVFAPWWFKKPFQKITQSCQITLVSGECSSDEMVATHDKFGATRSTLLVRLKDLEDQEAWYDFFETY